MTNYNLLDLNPKSQRLIIALLTGHYGGACWLARGMKWPLDISEVELSRIAMESHINMTDEDVAKFCKAIDHDEISVFSSDMSDLIRTLGPGFSNGETAPTPHDEDDDEDDEGEDFSFIDEDDLIDFLTNSVSIEDFEAGEADE